MAVEFMRVENRYFAGQVFVVPAEVVCVESCGTDYAWGSAPYSGRLVDISLIKLNGGHTLRVEGSSAEVLERLAA